MNEGVDSYPFRWIYRPHKAELGTLITTQLQALLNSFLEMVSNSLFEV